MRQKTLYTMSKNRIILYSITSFCLTVLCLSSILCGQDIGKLLTMNDLTGLYKSIEDDVYYIQFQSRSITYYLPEKNNDVTIYNYPCGFLHNTAGESISVSDLKNSGTRLAVITDYNSKKESYNVATECNIYTVVRDEEGVIELEGQNLFTFIPIQSLPSELNIKKAH